MAGSGSTPHASRRALADLARSGYQLLSRPTMQVDYEVRHLNRPVQVADLIDSSADLAECLVSSANGCGLIIGTRKNADSRDEAPLTGVSGTAVQVKTAPEGYT